MGKRMRQEDLSYQRRLYEDLLERRPDYGDVLLALGDLCCRQGDRSAGMEYDRRFAELNPVDPLAYYNLACDHSLAGDRDAALHLLTVAVALGYDDFRHMDRDPDLETVRNDPRYRRFRERMERVVARRKQP